MILDSDILIDLLRGYPAAVEWLAEQTETLRVSGIAAIEVVYGSVDASGLRAARRLVGIFDVEWPEPIDAQTAYGFAPLHLSDGIDGPDSITAAIALRLGVSVATFNAKHFRAVPGLTIEQPYVR